MLFYEVKTQ